MFKVPNLCWDLIGGGLGCLRRRAEAEISNSNVGMHHLMEFGEVLQAQPPVVEGCVTLVTQGQLSGAAGPRFLGEIN